MDDLQKVEKIINSDLNDSLISKVTGISRQTIHSYRNQNKDLSKSAYKNIVKIANLYDTYKFNHLSVEEKKRINKFISDLTESFDLAIKVQTKPDKKELLIKTKRWILSKREKIIFEIIK